MVSNKLLPDTSEREKTNQLRVTFVALGVLALTVCILLWPFAIIYALRGLFHLDIPYNLYSWVCVLILQFSLAGPARVSNRVKQ